MLGYKEQESAYKCIFDIKIEATKIQFGADSNKSKKGFF